MDRVLIVTERTPNSPDTHTVGATPRRHQVALDAKRLIIIDSKEDEQQNVWRALGFTPGFHPPTRPGYTEAGMGRETVDKKPRAGRMSVSRFTRDVMLLPGS